jgi:hypothetical protein
MMAQKTDEAEPGKASQDEAPSELTAHDDDGSGLATADEPVVRIRPVSEKVREDEDNLRQRSDWAQKRRGGAD